MGQILRILKETKRFWPYYLTTSIFIIVISLLNLANPLLNKFVVDILVHNVETQSADASSLIVLLVLIVVSDVFITLFTNIAGYIGDILGTKLNSFLSSKFYKRVLSLDIGYFDNELSGKILNKMQRGIENITQFINQMLNSFLPFFLTAFFTIIFLGFYSIEIAILLALLFPIYIVISDKSSKAWRVHQDKSNKIQDFAFGRVLESINSIRVVKSFIQEKVEFRAYKNQRKQIEAITKVQSSEWHKFDIYRRFVLNVILFGIYAYIVYFTFNGRYTISEMVLLLQLVTQARFPLFAMSFILSQIQQAQAGSKDFFEVISQPAKIKDADDATTIESAHGYIEFKNVDFSYDGSKQVLNNVSFQLQPGEKLAIVGESGEGKSTLTNLLLRFYEPQNGEIILDGQNINGITQESLHKNIGVVLQESFLFSGSVKENIKYGMPNATDEEVVNAAKAANAHDFILKFPNGYETEIGERGIKLSGGQKQRISIARAILKNSPILILDEATSSLDSKAEKEVQTALNKLMEGRTTIIIAHRLSTIRNVDHIIVLKGGQIIEEGNPTDLAGQNGIYAELLSLQNTIQQEKKEVNPTLKEFELHG